MARWPFLVVGALAGCVAGPNNGNGGRSGSPVDIAGPSDGADSGAGTDSGGGTDTGRTDTGGSDTGWSDTGTVDTGDSGTGIPTEEFTDLGSVEGEGVVEGDTTGLSDDYFGACGGGGYGDATFLWQAPRSGVWTFDLSGSSFDTVMAALDTDSAEELVCDDDGGDSGGTSLVTLELARNAQVGIVVDGYSGEGYFVLSIREN